jgi:septum formation protein
VRLILASASPRRAELLRAAGYTFDTVVVDIDERVRPGETPEAYVRRLATEKSAVASGFPGLSVAEGSPTTAGPVKAGPHDHRRCVVLAADTAVVVDSTILGKPLDDADLRRMLELLSGREHRVLTGISLRSGLLERGGVESTAVWFAPLTRAEIAWYVASGEGRDKAGGYAIQGLGARFIPRIDGSYSNVVGLPVHRVGRLMTEIGYAPESDTWS